MRTRNSVGRPPLKSDGTITHGVDEQVRDAVPNLIAVQPDHVELADRACRIEGLVLEPCR
jgi:hypothetical protein